ncbi:uncharacterized protein LOC135438178 isoform X14 [Drosophila montana]|uniref:uncharacterized protein LOC135438178 isoform X14 n=1 Tax=Drosophila montana TaxID=40370 RepID=UPI00313BB388
MEEDVLNALQMRSAYLSGGYDRDKRIIFIVNAFNDQQLWNRRCLQLTLDYLKRSLSASILQNGVSIIVNAQESSSRISRQHVRQIYALFGGDISVDVYLVRAEGFWEKHVEPCAKSQTKGEPLVLSKARLAKFIEPHNLPEELGGTLQFNYDLWLQQRKSIDEFSKTHAQTLGGMEQLLTLLKSLRPAEADVELKKCARLHTHVQRSIETAIEMGNAILARFNEVYETQTTTPHAAPVATPATATTTTATTTTTTANALCPAKPLLPPDLGCERARIELRLNEIEKKQTAIRTAWLELLRALREARELCTLAEGVAFVTNWILNQAEQLLSRQRSVGSDVRASETLRTAHDQLELECRDTYGCYAELLYKIEQFAKERPIATCQDLLSQRDFMQFVCRSFAERLERRRKVLMTALRFHRLLEQFEEQLLIANQAADAEPSELDWQQAEAMLSQLKTSQQLLGNIERELVREGEKLSDMLAMPVKDALGRDLQLDYSNDIAQLRRQIDASCERRQLCGQRLALQRLTLEQVTHIHGYEQEVRRALQWLNELYAVLLRCHSHVGCNIHEIQLQKDELQGFEETGRSIFNYGCQLLEAAQTLRLCCKLEQTEPEQFQLRLQRTWHSLQSIAQEQMTRLRVSAVFHRSVEAYYRQLRDLRPLLTHELATQLQQQRQQHNRSSSGISSDAEASPELSPAGGGVGARLQRHLLAREQLLVEVGRMVRLGRLLKKRLKEPFVLDALTGKSVVPDELPLDCSPSPMHDSGRNSSAGSESIHAESSATLTVTPTGSNELACAAISHKLGAIAEVAESLDAVIRDCSDGELDLSSATHKKLGSNGMGNEDWQSRSTEDESFATASEGNFTPNSHSSSFQTASGRTSSYIGSAKNSFDEADDSTLSNFEIPELPQSPVNMSFESSELSYFSARHPPKCDDQDSVVGVAELHSQSVTPTPDDEQQQQQQEQQQLLAQPIESDSELEGYGLDAAHISTELMPSSSTAVTPEIVDPYLETKSSVQAVEETLNGFSKRQLDVTSSLENWTTSIAEKREVEYLLEKVMSDNEETVAKSTQVDTQLYPVFSTSSLDSKQLLTSTREKLTYVTQDIERAQEEIQQRIQTTLSIQTKDQQSLTKIEQVINNLRMLKAKLDGIKYDYRTLLESVLQFLENIVQLRREIDAYFAKQQQHPTTATTAGASSGVERTIAEHEKFRDHCMDKFRSLITQSELLIDRVRVLEPPGAREIDTDRILKLLENLRIHFESNSSATMSTLERLEKIEQFRSDLEDIDRSLDSVSKQLHDINGQSVDSLAAAKTTSLAFEYFERTIELLEKRIEKFTESTSQQLLISNPESESYVKDELRKLNDKWQSFKDQVKQKRKSLNQANEFFEVVEKIDAEYREISYFYSSVSNKVPYLRDAVEASNLVNDIEKYVTSRESALRSKLDSASQCAHDMNKVSTLYNDVMNIFQAFIKLKMDINTVQERLKQDQRQREQRERESREQAEREQAMREAEARERLAQEERTRLEAQRQQAAIEQAQRELAARQLSLREQAVREEEARLQAVREQAAREQFAREQAAREEEQRIQTLRDIAKREEELRLQALREEEARLHAKREDEAKLKREEEIRLRREEEIRLQREEESRQKRENEARIQREEITRLQTLRDQVDKQRIVTENIRKDIQVNQIFTELRYASPLFVRPLKDALTREGERFVFECEVTGTPEPSVEWFKDGISIQSNADYKTSFDKGICRLVIEETFAADTARFSCRASNLVGTCDTNATLTVRENAAELQLVPPRILRFLETGKATEGTSFQFSCVVSGVPLPTVQWFKNDKCIDDSPDYVISYNNGEAQLRFDEVFLEDDAVYTCSASNPAGIEHCSASLIVEPLEPTELPCFKMPLQNAMARVGQKIKLEAMVSGIPQPEICWLHNGKPFQPRDSKYENGRVTLTIPQAYPNDAGSYVLSAKNLAGEAYSSCNIIVKGRLPNETSDSEMASDIEPIRPAVHIPLKDVSIFEGKPVRLDCVIVGQPEPEVIWYHNERPVKESADVQLLFQGDRCSLFIQEVYQEDAGNYKVVAINSAGETSSSCDLKVTPLNMSEPATRAHIERQSLPKETQPKFERLLSDVLADEGERVVLEVQTSGDQPLRAQWYLTNKELQLDDRVATQCDAEAGIFKLILNNVAASDKGVYTVKVSNNAGDAKCFSHLIVKSVNAPENRRSSQSSVEIVERHLCPEFKELFSDKQAQIDDVVKFECIVLGKPTPKVHWYFNDQPVHGHNFLVSTSGDRQVLTIQQLTHDAVGKISCMAENEAGKATCVAFLNIIGSSPLPASSDVQSMTQEHNTESSRVTIKKQTFTTTSTSQVNSYEGNVPQTEVHHSSAHIDQSLKQLGQQRPEIVESHQYQELHKSKEMNSPSVQQKSFTLVQSSSNGAAPLPALTMPESPTRLRKEIAPRFTTPLTGKIVDQGVNVSMEAIYDGYPSPEIKVEKNGDQLFENAHTKISNKFNRVTIELKEVGVADAGRYAVTASNAVGQSTSTADLVVKKTIFPPVFGRRLQAQVSKKGERLIMEVEVTGLPDPTVTWLKDDKPLKDAGISEHRLLAQGNSYKLIIEKAQTTDSGKYMVRATNAGGEAKSIADCAILEPSPERMQEVVKTIIYEAPASEFKTENHFKKEPQSYQTNQTDATTANDLHGLSESKVITEHRCTTEATMRLEHKSTNLDLPELNLRPKTPTTTTTTNNTTNNNNTASMDQTDTQASYKTGVTQTPPPVPPKPCTPVVATTFGQQPQPQPQQPAQMQTQINTRYESSTSEHKSSSSFEYFKKIDEETRPKPMGRRPLETVVRQPQAQTLSEELRSMNLIPGAPPEFCYTPKTEKQLPKQPLIHEKIKILEEVQPREPPPQGGVPVFPPPLNLQSVQHETTLTKEIKVDYGQPIVRPAAVLATPAQQNTRSPSPKPSAEGVAMSKLWTPSGTAGYTSDVEQKTEQQISINKLATPTPTKELNAPFLVQQVAKTITQPPSLTPAPAAVTRLVNIELEPGTPPEICYAPKQPEEVRRHSLVESMEQKLEQNLLQGPSKVLPHSVPTLTPVTPPKSNCSAYRPPPPVMPGRLGAHYESDYESDRYKYSGSESDEPGNRARQQQATMETSFKSSGYAADTEEHSSYRKSESSFYETKSSTATNAAPTQAKLQPEPPAQLYFTPQPQAPPQSSYSQEAKNYKYTSSSMSSNMQQSSSSSTHHETKYSSNATPLVTSSPVPAQRKTPAAEFSDYSSEVDERFRSVSRANESDSDIKGYRVVFPPTPTPRTNIANGHKSPVVVVTPSPMEFEPTPQQLGSYTRPKFEPIGKEIRHEIKTETSSKQYQTSQHQQQQQQQQQQHVFKPKPVAAKFIAATQQQQQQPLPSARPTMYYNAVAGAPMHMAKVAHETKNVMQMHESTESSQRVVNMQQTKRVIHFDSQQQQQLQQQQPQPALEPFPYSPAGSRTPSRQSHLPPPATPTKFIPGEFRESDYESEVEGARIQPLWSPYGDGLTRGYRRVAPPQTAGRSCSLPRTYERVLSPMEFDRGPEMPSKIQVDVNTLRKEQRGGSTVTTQHRTQSLNRNSTMRQQQYGSRQQDGSLDQTDQQQHLRAGTLPRYGYSTLHEQAEGQGKRMGSTFLQKSHQFIEDVSRDMQSQQSSSNGHVLRPGFRRAPSEGSNQPQAYRDESRVSQYDLRLKI